MMGFADRCFPSSWLVMLAAGALIASLPLLSDTECYVEEFESQEVFSSDVSPQDYILGDHMQPSRGLQFGEQHGTAMVISWLSGVLWTRKEAFQSNEPLQRWASRFAKATIAQGLVVLTYPWVFAVCPPSLAMVKGISYGVYGLLYVYSQVALCLTALHRLRLVGAEESANLARKLLITMGCLASLAVALLVPFMAKLGGIVIQVAYGLVLFGAVSAFVSFQVTACVGLRKAAQLAKLEAEREGVSTQEASLAMNVATAVACSASTTILMMSIQWVQDLAPWTSMLFQVSYVLDIGSDSVLAMAAANAIGGAARDRGDGTVSVRAYSTVGALVEQRRARLIEEKLQASLAATSGPALAVAALLEETSPEELLKRATQRFRSVQWATLVNNSELVTGGGLLHEVGAGKSELYDLSAPCKLSACDVFWSHSWSDNGVQKWEAIQTWAAEFKEKFGRWPSLWFDKLCINQTSISEDLLCLPVFLAACNGIMVTSGNTYASRLWCALELFVYFSMATEDASRKPPTVLLLGDDAAAKSSVRLTWLAFDVQNCNCYHAADKTRILEIIAEFPDGTSGFNSYIRDLARTVLSKADESDDAAKEEVILIMPLEHMVTEVAV